MTKLIL